MSTRALPDVDSRSNWPTEELARAFSEVDAVAHSGLFVAVRLEVSDDQLLYRISAGGNALGSDTFDRSSPELQPLIREMLRFA